MLLDQLEFIFVPFVNPDGYEVYCPFINYQIKISSSIICIQYTWTNDRLWRKNRRSPPRGSQCYGVDVNWSYNENWGKVGYFTEVNNHCLIHCALE